MSSYQPSHKRLLTAMLLLAASIPICAQSPIDTPDIPAKFVAPNTGYDYVKHVVMIPMRDGVKLYTVIVIPKGATHAPILLTRTPYDAASRATRDESPHMLDELPQGDDVFVHASYIRVFQDVRGKYGSEGKYVMTPPPLGPLNTSGINDTTDAYDTIDWLVKNLRESNGKVGMIGSSYEGFTVVMALIDPHPALKVACPESPMVDGWMGDDWFHNGAFREQNMPYIYEQEGTRGGGVLGHDRVGVMAAVFVDVGDRGVEAENEGRVRARDKKKSSSVRASRAALIFAIICSTGISYAPSSPRLR